MSAKSYDVIVIGSGPAGEGASIKAAKGGRRVAIIEQYHKVGGGCTHWGTIPSKTFIHTVQQMADLRSNILFTQSTSTMRLSYADLMAMVQHVVGLQVRERLGYYERNEIDVLEGHATFLDERTVSVQGPEGITQQYQADHFVIAAGSSPYHPDDVDFTHPRVLDSDTVLDVDTTPHSITIYGAGVIGCEYASAFRCFGVKVNLVNTRDRLLAFMDDEISDALSYHLREQGVLIRHNEEYERVETLDDSVILHLATGKKIKSDHLLWANGRTGNSRGLGLDTLGIVPDHRGNITVNDNYQTLHPHIYAVGDIVGYPSLAGVAYDQGRYVGEHILSGEETPAFSRLLPTGIYTMPEISYVGRTERELTAARVPYEIGHAYFRNIARAQITGHTTGVLKILFHRETLEILGIHCFGHQAAEILHIGQAIMAQPGNANTITFFTKNTFNYPTMAEAYRVAALNGLNRIF